MMRIFDETKTIELAPEQCDTSKGDLVPDRLFLAHHEALLPQAAQGHEDVVAVHADGTKECRWIEDVPATEGSPAYDEYEDILVYAQYSPEGLARREERRLRQLRERECFSVINRGRLWYEMLTPEQVAELRTWYEAWLNVTKTRSIPERPAWVDETIKNEEVVL